MSNKLLRPVCVTLLLFFCFAQCKKHRDTPKTELEKLPPITQTGANTFGCLLNGNAWTPIGYSSPYPNYRVIVDPAFSDGNLDIRVYRIINGIREDISIASDSIKAIGLYKIADNGRTQHRFQKSSEDLSTPYCEIYYGGIFHRQGYLKITKYDLINGIVSGEFEIKAINVDCGYGDTIKITIGRFDKKL